ncbi:MAG: 60S ribosomal protein L37a [Aigarchaeota archaeon]|nr:60S ribosomal protein L37a [Aigarchaeota archaeon]MDW8092428.1 50S ribosomal protein L37ae [Nitrososphaerota archaeon]
MRAGKRRTDTRFGARYGARLRKVVSEIEQSQYAIYKCERCGKIGVRRVALGIWECKKCGEKFAGAAWSPAHSE